MVEQTINLFINIHLKCMILYLKSVMIYSDLTSDADNKQIQCLLILPRPEGGQSEDFDVMMYS